MLALAVGSSGGCDKSSTPPASDPDSPPASAAAEPEPAAATDPVDEAGLDWLLSSVDAEEDPCADFYQYACGGWIEATQRPADKARYSRAFTSIQDRNLATLRTLLEKWAADYAEDGVPPDADDLTQRKGLAGRYYAVCMDEAAVAKAGIEPLERHLEAIEALTDKKQVMHHAGELHATVFGRNGRGAGDPPFFDVGVDADSREAPDMNILHVGQGGLGLPSRELYLADKAQGVRDAYTVHLAKMLELSGVSKDRATAMAPKILAFETTLAKAHKKPADLRDPYATYNKLGYDGLVAKAKGADLSAFFEGSGYPTTKNLNVATPAYFKALGRAIKSTDLDVLKAYLRYHVVQASARYLSPELEQAAFELMTFTRGVEQMEPRWQRCANETMYALPDAVGPGFVERAFAGESKQIANDMIDRINRAMEQSLPRLAWMDEATRQVAVEKIAAVTRKIGYPDTWEDYSPLSLDGDRFANALEEKRFAFAREKAKIDAPVDRGEWHMPAPLVNAYYNPTNNEIAFPAGIMQPPFFGASLPAPMNYGGIGAVIGHELTHGFDDQGSKYDKDGRLAPWWSKQATKQFESRVACVVDQYGAYEPLPGLRVDGKLTAGENIADIGGVKEAYFAYKTWESENGAAAPVAEGFTNDQIFFIAWAQNWCFLSTEDFLGRQVETDPHSPGMFRSMGPLADLPQFAEAFECAEGTPMAPKDRCEVW